MVVLFSSFYSDAAFTVIVGRPRSERDVELVETVEQAGGGAGQRDAGHRADAVHRAAHRIGVRRGGQAIGGQIAVPQRGHHQSEAGGAVEGIEPGRGGQAAGGLGQAGEGAGRGRRWSGLR